MNNQIVNISFKEVIGKPKEKEILRTLGHGWKNQKNFRVDDFINTITKQGYAFSNIFRGGRKRKSDFIQGNVFTLDIDEGLTINAALENTFIKDNAAFIYTTPSHTAEKHKFRIIFICSLPVVGQKSYEMVVASFLELFPQADKACKDCSRLYYGNPNAEVWHIGNIIQPQTIEEIVDKYCPERNLKYCKTIYNIPEDKNGLALEIASVLGYCQHWYGREYDGSYLDWVRICFAVYSVLPNEVGVELIINRWGEESEYKARQLLEEYKTKGGIEVSIKTLIYYAKNNTYLDGWEKFTFTKDEYPNLHSLLNPNVEVKVEVESANVDEVEVESENVYNNDDWVKELQFNMKKDGSKKLINSASNAFTICVNEFEDLVYDEFADDIFWIKSPIGGIEKGGFKDGDLVILQKIIFEKYGTNLSLDNIYNGFKTGSKARKFHPVRDYLNSIKIEKRNGLADEMLIKFFNAEDNQLNRDISRMWLIQAVKRVMAPGCQADYVLVLEGKQGIRKTKAIRCLAGKWHQPNVGTVGTKDSFQNLQGKWICEFGELDSFRRVEQTTIKDFITKTVDVYRPAYGRNVIEQPRQCVFVGTTNESKYLLDSTGGRRYWCVAVDDININELKKYRDDIWADAYRCFKDGLKAYPDEEKEVLLRQNQEERRVIDPWEDKIREYLETYPEDFIYSRELLTNVIIKPTEAQTTGDYRRLSAVMCKITDWERNKDTSKRGYKRIEK